MKVSINQKSAGQIGTGNAASNLRGALPRELPCTPKIKTGAEEELRLKFVTLNARFIDTIGRTSFPSCYQDCVPIIFNLRIGP